MDDTATYTYQPGPDEPVSEAVIRATAHVSGQEPAGDVAGLPPLYEAVDPDALDALFTATGDAPAVRFTYSGYAVTVDETRRVTVADA